MVNIDQTIHFMSLTVPLVSFVPLLMKLMYVTEVCFQNWKHNFGNIIQCFTYYITLLLRVLFFFGLNPKEKEN